MIIKANGERVEFNESRLFNSLMRSGADEETANKVIQNIRPNIVEDITTRKIYHMAFKELRKVDNPAASRYEIKWAMMRLGKQQGFSFEQYMERLFKKMGYRTKTNVIARGQYISHEIDIVLEKNSEKIMVECKHRSNPVTMIHVKTALAVYARFLDLKKKFNKVWLVTNTRFTHNSINYSNGVGIRLVGWDSFAGRSLQNLIDSYKVYPITVLKSVDNPTLQKLLNKNIVVVSDILAHRQKLGRVLGKSKAPSVLKEAEELLKK